VAPEVFPGAPSAPDPIGSLPTSLEPAAAVTEGVVASSLAELVGRVGQPEALSRDMECLAGAIYFEARGEPLSGQLAVGRVIVDRSQSRRFPASYCGVVYQPSQFSFVRGGRMPAINQSSRAWQEARAIAVIADRDLWESPAKGALFFHAKHVRPGWKLQRVAQVNTHVFYR
jgi:N-acetylmuramoyl-L-alanine amidase